MTHRTQLLISGALILGVAALAGARAPEWALRGYLVGWLMCLGVALGSMAMLMMHHLTGGMWGAALRRPAEAAAMTIPLLGLASLPLMIGMKRVFPWADPVAVSADALLQHRAPLYATPVVLIRWALYFAIWSGFAWRLRSLSLRHDRTGDDALLQTSRAVSAAGLVAYFITMSFAAIDWVGSREVDWYSSTFGLLFVVGQAAAGLAFLIIVLARSGPALQSQLRDPTRAAHDLGNLLQTVVVLWAYIAFAQFLVIWIGNSQDDVVWFHHRNQGLWHVATISLIVLHFGTPFILLLFQRAKRDLGTLAAIAAGVLAMRFVDVLWMVVPSAHGPMAEPLRWPDLAMPLGLGLIWLSAFAWILSRHPLATRSSTNPKETGHGTAAAPASA
jgi:hypothetical protein